MCTDVTVIIPMYNANNTIIRAITSVLNQTLIGRIEIICIDDGSTDNTINSVKKINRDCIKILNQQHCGAGPARNLGIANAKGRYIAFLDADDEFVDTDALEKMVKAADYNQVNICGSLRKVFENGIEKEAEIFKDISIKDEGVRISYSQFQKNYDYQSFIYSKKFLVDNGISFPALKRYQDPPFMVKAMALAGDFFVVPIHLYRYYYEEAKRFLITKNIDDVMQGMAECLTIAAEYKFIDLAQIIDEQMSLQYKESICTNLTITRIETIRECNKLYHICLDKDLTLVQEMLNIFNSTEKNINQLVISNDLMRRLVLINTKHRPWKRYFDERDIKKVIVHGLGTYGDILIDILRENNIEILYAIDKAKKNSDRVIVRPEYLEKECDGVIVSLAEPDELLYEYKKRGIYAIAFRDMVKELSEGLI